ncbi:hypothetical protein [Bradyrhizobium nanningense]|uniref:hypothetical protein n=1 Tax=Bradyrhizobium nanningense TaxID=1325118 RepID=UPI001008E2E4|nr:hypothetical protein [Bradyrhizobium nanningense]
MTEEANSTSKGAFEVSLAGVTDEQAKALQSISKFGTTVMTEGANLTRYVGRVLGTVPGRLVLGDPLSFVRSAIAAQRAAEMHISVENLRELKCVHASTNSGHDFSVTTYGAGLLRAVSD